MNKGIKIVLQVLLGLVLLIVVAILPTAGVNKIIVVILGVIVSYGISLINEKTNNKSSIEIPASSSIELAVRSAIIPHDFLSTKSSNLSKISLVSS